MESPPTSANGAGAGDAENPDAPQVNGQLRAAYRLIEAAQLLGITRDTAYRQAKADTLPVPAYRCGSRWYVSRAKLDALLGN